jgi:acyl-CoA reductase-like NAD-dependent aldehyde dehydrogenase
MSLTTKRASAASTGSKRIDTARLGSLAALVTTTSGEHDELEIENPATRRVLAGVPRCTGEDVELAVQRARGLSRARRAGMRSRRSSTWRWSRGTTRAPPRPT